MVEIVSSPSELRAKSLMEGADLVLIVNGIEMNRWSDVVDLGGSEIVGSPGTPFDELLDAARSAVVRACNRAARAADGFEPRSLGKGERVYHRKIGSGGNADVFDEGRTDPCPHGASGFKKFSKAPKALKGMQRRYLNVTDQSLYHCGKYPNCGMYMVEGVA